MSGSGIRLILQRVHLFGSDIPHRTAPQHGLAAADVRAIRDNALGLLPQLAARTA